MRGSELRMVAWEVTRSCNLSCIHCRASAERGPYPGELSHDECIAFLDDLATFSRPVVILTGGEPLLREDIFAIAQHGTNHGFRMVMAINGTLLTEKVCKRMIDSGIQRISISLDGAKAESHDRFRGVEGAFDEALNGIRIARESGLEFQINTTVTQVNLSELPRIFDLAVRLKAVAHHIFLLVPTGRGEDLAKQSLLSEEYEETLHWFCSQMNQVPLQLKATCAPHYQRVLRQRAKAEGRRVTPKTHGLDAMTRGCLGGISFCFVSHVGNVQPCGYLEVSSGQIRERPLSEIWTQAPMFKELRNYRLYKGKCGRCEYVSVCGGCRARAYAQCGDYLSEEPLCLYEPKKKTSSDQGSNSIDEVDRKILNLIQSRFPIAPSPFFEVGKALGLPEQEVLQRVRRLKELEIIRRIGGNFDSKKLGFMGTLCAAKVPPEEIESFNEVINSYPGVTHNYSRNHDYNIWFTFIGESMEQIESALSEISEKTGIQEILNLPAKRTFKIRVDFKI